MGYNYKTDSSERDDDGDGISNNNNNFCNKHYVFCSSLSE